MKMFFWENNFKDLNLLQKADLNNKSGKLEKNILKVYMKIDKKFINLLQKADLKKKRGRF